jgi:hypothetical protein
LDAAQLLCADLKLHFELASKAWKTYQVPLKFSTRQATT